MKPKKSLGQNFLTSEAAVYKIVKAAEIAPGEAVLEVGPGRGVLTKALLEAGAKVIAVEKDEALIQELEDKFQTEIKNKKLNIKNADILETDPQILGLENGKYKIVANIPYYITGQLLKKFLSADPPSAPTGGGGQPSKMVLLLQKEVVERIIAQDKKESILSLSVKAYGEPKKVTVVNRGSFFPAPNVDSAVIAIENISKKFFESIGNYHPRPLLCHPREGGDLVGPPSGIIQNPRVKPEDDKRKKPGLTITETEEKFFETVKAGFAHKRKVLISNLGAIASREKLAEVFGKNKIAENIRAEDLNLDQWKIIVESLN